MIHGRSKDSLDIAVIGGGISGLSAAWLLSGRHNVTLFEADGRVGGHSHTVDAGATPVDTGFIVYNEATYPNLTALFRHLDVPTKPSEMSFAVSLDNGRLEYAGTTLDALFAQRGNLISPRFWSMLRDLARFYRHAPADLERLGEFSLGAYLDQNGYGTAFRDDHLYPMAAAIWSTPAAEMAAYPAAAFIRFCDNHGLLKFSGRPLWRTVDGGSGAYVKRLTAGFADRILTRQRIRCIKRLDDRVEIATDGSESRIFDEVVIATHADQALRVLADPSDAETKLLGSFSYQRAAVVLHRDPALMPRRRKVWSSWNYAVDTGGDVDDVDKLSVTYWMNRLQGIPSDDPLFVTLNPLRAPGHIVKEQAFEHPRFNGTAMLAQKQLWTLQGRRNTWFCGAYFGAGFHEDGLQAGLAVAEQLGGVRRPWTVANESSRIALGMARNRRAAIETVSWEAV